MPTFDPSTFHWTVPVGVPPEPETVAVYVSESPYVDVCEFGVREMTVVVAVDVTTIALLVPTALVATVSLTEMVCEPAANSVAPPVNVWAPLSPTRNG